MRRLHRLRVLRPAPASPATATLVSEAHGRGQRGRARGRESAPGHGGVRAADCAGPRAHRWASTDRAGPSAPPSSSSMRKLCIRVRAHPSPLAPIPKVGDRRRDEGQGGLPRWRLQARGEEEQGQAPPERLHRLHGDRGRHVVVLLAQS